MPSREKQGSEYAGGFLEPVAPILLPLGALLNMHMHMCMHMYMHMYTYADAVYVYLYVYVYAYVCVYVYAYVCAEIRYFVGAVFLFPEDFKRFSQGQL